ncbi:MAG: biopolymer transporter ExbD [Planctomycetes bacterium]|nr:biopolymer transporter ExbD [Planctomycetota bacterium]
MAAGNRHVREWLDSECEFEIPTSMIDVVFLLLVFFLVATRFKLPEHKIDTESSGSFNQGPPPPVPVREFRVYVEGTEETGPVMAFEGAPVADAAELVYKLRVVNANIPNRKIVIVGKPDTPFAYVVWAVDACRRAGIDDVQFQGLPEIASVGTDGG